MKSSMRYSFLIIVGITLNFVIGNIQCTNNPMEPNTLQNLNGKSGSLSKSAITGIYSNLEGKFKFSFQVPADWKKTSHGSTNIKGTTDRSDVFVYSPKGNYIPRFTIIVFSHDPGYPPDCAEFWSQWRENRLKELYPDRFLGRVERNQAALNGLSAPKVVYDMLDESKTITYRSTEYTLVVGGKLCTIQTTITLSENSQNETKNILDGMLSSLTIKSI